METRMKSPQELYEDPKIWLYIPHKLHKSLGTIMKFLFEDWDIKVSQAHCFECNGENNFVTWYEGREVLATGVLLDENKEPLTYRVEEIKK